MPGFNTLEDKIKKELKKYQDEEMFWIYDIILKINSNSKDYLKSRYISGITNFNQLRELIIEELLKSESEDKIKYRFEAIKNAKIKFIKNEIFNEFKKDSRLCLFTLSSLNKHSLNKKESQIDLDYLVEDNSIEILTETLLVTNKDFKFISEKYIYIKFIINIFINKISERKLIKIKQEYKNKVKQEINSSTKFNDQYFINWSYDYLISKKLNFKKASHSCHNNEDKKLFIISYLDFLYLSDHQEHEILTIRMSKAWSQKKFRDGNKVKNPYHIPLTKKAKEELGKLSDFKNLSESDILERLINQMFLYEMCDKDGNLKY